MSHKYYIRLNICGYYDIHIVEDGWETNTLVSEKDFEGFIQCLDFLEYERG